MSLQAQEQALLDLLFDDRLRARFAAEGPAALAGRDLEPGELEDFAAVRADALELDAGMRRSMVLSELAVSYPLSFAVASCIDDGVELLRELVDARTLRTPAIERAVVFGRRLRELLDDGIDEPPRGALRTILETELGMAWTAASLRREAIDLGRPPAEPAAVPQDWRTVPVRVAAFVSAAVLPVSHAVLRAALCPVSDRELWRHLSRQPADAATLRTLLASAEPRLLVARAEIDRRSRCDPTARHQLVEVSEGFASILGYANWQNSIDDLLAELGRSGASDEVRDGVAAGFEELLRAGMLEPA